MLLQISMFVTMLAAAGALDCTHLPEGIYEVSCKSYTVCAYGVAIVTHCPKGTVYDEKAYACKDETTVEPPCGLIRDCSNLADGSYHDVETNCTSYYTCQHHTYYGHQHCTPGTVFDQSAGFCSWPNVVSPPCGTQS